MNLPKPILIISLVAILGIGGYFLYKSQADTSLSSRPEETTLSGSIKELLSLGRDMQCTFESTGQGYESSGKVYVANNGNKVRADFELTNEEGEITTSSMIQDGTMGYFWTSEMAQGYKMTIDPNDSIFDYEGSENNYSNSSPAMVDPNDDFDYDCQAWREDSSVFSAPANVEFIDISAQMEAVLEDIDTESMCSACNNLTGDAKTMCMQSLGCN